MEAGQAQEAVDYYGLTASFFTNAQSKSKTGSRQKPAYIARSDQKQCIYCKENHHANDCSKVPDVKSRKDIIKKKQVLLKTAVAEVCAGDNYAQANILFDEGAQRSFISEKLAQTLKVKPNGSTVISLATFGGTSQNQRHLGTTTIYLLTDVGAKIPLQVMIVPTNAVPLRNISNFVLSSPHLRNLKLAHPVIDEDQFDISLLIGADHYWSIVIVSNQTIRGNGPTAVSSSIGYLLSGPVETTSVMTQSCFALNVNTDKDRFWKLESIGIIPEDDQGKDKLQTYQENAIKFNDGKYEAKLPWKEDHAHLPTNYEVIKRRTESLIRRLRREPKILEKYAQILQEQKRRDFIEKLDDNEKLPPQVHYIPHHAVRKDSATTPIRIVATLHKHLDNNANSWVSRLLKRNLYVDNILSSFQTEDEVLRYFRDTRDLMLQGGFNLRSWASDSRCLQVAATEEGVLDSDKVTKLLGMLWTTDTDEISHPNRDIPITQNVTKRTILQFTSRVYDPLGLLIPVLIRAKILLEDLWKGKHTWDKVLPDDIYKKWLHIARDVNEVMEMRIPRRLFNSYDTDDKHPTADDTILHVFVDASIQAYGAIAYLCRRQQSTLVMANSHVAPLKKITLPKLELMAAVIGTLLARHILQAIDIQDVIFWSDSQIVLHWLSTSRGVNRFVQNRVTDIRDITQNRKWKYCPTNHNPADQTQWPVWMQADTITMATLTDETQETDEHPFSGSLLQDGPSPYDEEKPLNVTELQNAEHRWLQNCQHTEYAREISSLKTSEKRLPIVRQLKLFIDDRGDLRCGGRIQNAPLEYATKFPYLLHPKHTLTRLIVRDVHTRHLHTGENATITYLHQKNWIPSIRRCVQTEIRKCVICKRINGKPYSAPDPPPLPKFRLEDSALFTVTGEDFTGALHVKVQRGNMSKAYICLFTCASTRALHLEVVQNLTESSFMQAFKRFCSRKSLPHIMVSDNAATYQAASSHLRQLFDSQSMKEALNQEVFHPS
ncbi:uncharacterized protein LOC128554787 [Mercenaria mercenaria]|uniref:uncharacterized protein LOC128554787 n=1 Tax=Mercenaria mercenaria TaxID=6596 RepID=UPI00234EE5A7|nr:uncharacterized protein LOC128554787 [Mercenaria mercenaria]